MPRLKKRGISFVLKKYGFCLLYRVAVHHRHQGSETFFLKRSAQSLHIHTIRDVLDPAQKTGVDIGLNGVGNDKIGLFLLQNRGIGPDELTVRHGIDAPAVHLCFNETAA